MNTTEGAARKGRPRPSERLLTRLRTMGLPIPEDAEIRRTYAGYWQRSQGAWVWVLSPMQVDDVGSVHPVTELLRCGRLVAWRQSYGGWRVEPFRGHQEPTARDGVFLLEPVADSPNLD